MSKDKFNEGLKQILKIQNWQLYDYQNVFLKHVNESKFKQLLLFSETGTGKTITTFLPLLTDKICKINKKLIYIAPQKALVADIFNNLGKLISDLKINISLQKRTGDESYQIKKKQLIHQPDIILTTPESLAILLTKKDSKKLFLNLHYLIIDEISEVINTKRGDLLALITNKILYLNKKIRVISSSTHVENKIYLKKWLSINGKTKVIENKYKKEVDVKVLYSDNIPNYGHSCDYLTDKIYKILKNQKTIIFVNTRAQAEILFMKLFSKYKDLRLAIHHGSLSKKIRFKTEESMRNSNINAIISTSSLEMGIDWDVINQIISIGTPKSINKLIQRIGRSNHKYYSIPKAFIVPTNKLEFFETQACLNLLLNKNYDLIEEKVGSKDVLCQYLQILACNYGFEKKKVFKEIINTYPYKDLKYSDFCEILSFVYDGGYILKNYSQWSKLVKDDSNNFFISNSLHKQNILMNIGTIVDSTNIKVVLGRKVLGEVDDNFANFIKKGDSFNFSGISLECLDITSEEIQVKKLKKKTLNAPIYWGGNLSFKKNLTQEILRIFSEGKYENYPKELREFIYRQKQNSALPMKNLVIIESFPHDLGTYLFMHTFQGRQTNQTLSHLLIESLSECGYLPLNYIVNEYSLGIFVQTNVTNFNKVIVNFYNNKLKKINFFETHLAKKVFKEISYISGLLPKNNFRKAKNYINSDNIFQTLKKYQPSHILLKITMEEIKNYFTQSSQLNNFFDLQYNYKPLKFCSEFSLTLIKEKPKLKINSPI